MQKLENAYHFIFSEWFWAMSFFFVFFSAMYFFGAWLTEIFTNYLTKKNKIHVIQHALKEGQKRKEIIRSLTSIFVFSIQAIPLQWLINKGVFEIRFDNFPAILWQIPMLFFWNEIHFFAVHWLLHQKWFFKNVHHVHHWSKEPTAFSVYSFHWLEAFLLGTVIFFPLIFFKLNIFAALSLPIFSIFLNLIGHCNHESNDLKSDDDVMRFSFRHSMHHKYSRGNFGFMLPFLDQIFNTQLPKNKK